MFRAPVHLGQILKVQTPVIFISTGSKDRPAMSQINNCVRSYDATLLFRVKISLIIFTNRGTLLNYFRTVSVVPDSPMYLLYPRHPFPNFHLDSSLNS